MRISSLALRLLTRLGVVWSVVGLTLVLLLVLDLSLAFFLSSADDPADLAASIRRNGLPDEPWVDVLLDETERSAAVEWRSYVYWRRKPFQGRFINVDSSGLRRTWRPASVPNEESRRPLRVFVFGGSTVWGSGVRDDHTIPSELSRLLAAGAIRAEVVNFGETGYVSTQEVFALIRELQAGNVPDLVIFYDGVNDTFSSLQAGEAGIPQNERNRVAEFNLLGSRRRLVRAALSVGIERSGTGRLARILRKAKPWSGDGGDASGLGNEELAAATVAAYERNVEIVEGLGRTFGFEAAFYWQPAVFTKPHLTAYERERLEEHEYAAWMYRRVTVLLGDQPFFEDGSQFLDLSGIFFEESAPRYLDFCHTNETANREIAARIHENLVERGWFSERKRRSSVAAPAS